MYYYKIYGWTIETDIKFDMLVEDENKRGEIKILEGEIPEELVEKYKDEVVVLDKELGWFRNKSVRMVLTNGNVITYKVLHNADSHPEYVPNFILGWGMSALAFQRNQMAIHCSAVRDDNGAVLICGESGAGKSTVTTEFHNAGYKLMADDMSVVEVVNGTAYANPAFPYQKLVRNAAVEKGFNLDDLIYINEEKDKFLVPYQGDFKIGCEPIRAIIVLGKSDEKEVISYETKGMEKLVAAASNLFIGRLLGAKAMTGETGKMAMELAKVVPIYKILRPAEGNTVSEVCKRALEYAT